MALALLALGAAAAAICVPVEGRTAEEWAPVALRWALRRRRAEEGYRSPAPGAGMRIGPEGEAGDEGSLPPELAGVELLSVPYGGAEVGVIRERGAGTYTAAMALRPGAFALRDPAEQERSLDCLGRRAGGLRARRQPGPPPAVDRADRAGPGR